jgi:hypothetical protein
MTAAAPCAARRSSCLCCPAQCAAEGRGSRSSCPALPSTALSQRRSVSVCYLRPPVLLGRLSSAQGRGLAHGRDHVARRPPPPLLPTAGPMLSSPAVPQPHCYSARWPPAGREPGAWRHGEASLARLCLGPGPASWPPVCLERCWGAMGGYMGAYMGGYGAMGPMGAYGGLPYTIHLEGLTYTQYYYIHLTNGAVLGGLY